MRSTLLAAGLIAGLLALALAGCGGESAPPSTAARAGTHPDAPPPAAAGTGNPRDALIRIADLSSTWSAARPMGSALGCDGWDPLDRSIRVLESPHFNRETVDIQQTLGVFDDDAAGRRAYRRLNAAPTQRCVRRALRARLRFASGGGVAFVSPVTVARVERMGEHSNGVRYTAEVNAELGRSAAYIVTINTQIGSAASSLTVYQGVEHLAEAAYDELAVAQEQRLNAAYG